jgi:hypothetical protein
MMYGSFQFSLKTLSANSLTRSTEFKWVDTDRVGDLPYVQNLGIAKDNVEIEGVFYPKLNAATQYNSVDKAVIGIAFVTLCETRRKFKIFSWFLLIILGVDIGITGRAFFQLLNRVEKLEWQLHCLAIKNGENYVQ